MCGVVSVSAESPCTVGNIVRGLVFTITSFSFSRLNVMSISFCDCSQVSTCV